MSMSISYSRVSSKTRSICLVWSVSYLGAASIHRPPIQGFCQKTCCIGDLREAFLREGADFNINGSGVILRRLHDTFQRN
jgi:hypothetical protein